MLSKKQEITSDQFDADASSDRQSDAFSILGTVLLWLYWPSFNGATAGVGDISQLYTTVNTVSSLIGSCVATFALSYLMNHKINPVDIQNATLAGGVAIGASSNLNILPIGAFCVGIVAGLISTFGFNVLQEKVRHNFPYVHDSCGVH